MTLKRFFILVCSSFLFCLNAQTPSFEEKIRIQLWGDLDAYPEFAAATLDEEKGVFDYPIQQIKKTAPFLINGMVYGWDFVYVPYDKTRGVAEYFEITEIRSIQQDGQNVIYSSPWIDVEKNRFSCWCEFYRTPDQVKNYKMWSSIVHPVISGRGYGSVEKGVDGIKLAAEDALKNAVREYYREQLKNKPKEITGSVLIRSEPLMGVDAGRYALSLDFFLERGRIKEYKF